MQRSGRPGDRPPRREWWSDLHDDARFAWRQARRARGMTAMALLTFALAIGATTAIFSVVDHVVFRPLPFAQPERLVALGSVDSAGTGFNLVSMANWMDWRAGTRTLDESD